MTDGAPRPPLPVWQHFLAQWVVFTLTLGLALWWNTQSVANDTTTISAWLGAIVVIGAALVLGQIVHEWGHFGGAVASASAYTIKPVLTPLFFDFDYAANNKPQTLALSAGGPLGNVSLLLVLLVWLPPLSFVAMVMLSALVGQLVFVLFLEGPVSRRIVAGEAPIDALIAHFGQGKPLFHRCYLIGAIAGFGTLALLGA